MHRHYDAHDVIANEVEHLRKQLEGFALIFLLRIFLRVTPQMNTLAQMVKRRQMLTPVRIDTLQHHATLKTTKRFPTNQRHLGFIHRIGRLQHPLKQLFFGQIRLGLEHVDQRYVHHPFIGQRHL